MRLTSTGFECELYAKDPATGEETFAAAGGLTECKLSAKILPMPKTASKTPSMFCFMAVRGTYSTSGQVAGSKKSRHTNRKKRIIQSKGEVFRRLLFFVLRHQDAFIYKFANFASEHNTR